MSRIGKLPIAIPAGVNVKVENGGISVKGPKGELSQKIDSTIEAKVEDGQIVFTRENDGSFDRLFQDIGACRRRVPCFQSGSDFGVVVGLLAQYIYAVAKRDKDYYRYRT